MFTQTEDGLVLDFDDEDLDSAVSRSLAVGLMSLMKALWQTLTLEPVSARRAQEAKLSARLAVLSGKYISESLTCSRAEAWFAASVMGMAAMETVLLLACIAEKQTVITTKAWTSFHKKRKMEFRDRLMHADLGKLLEIAKELKWFPSDTAHHSVLDEAGDWKEWCEPFPEFLDTPECMIEKSIDMRNLIHPARCIREGNEINEHSGQLALGLFYLSMIGILHNLGRDLLEPNSTKLVITYSPQLKRIMSARETVRDVISEESTAEDNAKRILESVEATRGVLEIVRPTIHDLQNPEG